jgi:hypothetical protein
MESGTHMDTSIRAARSRPLATALLACGLLGVSAPAGALTIFDNGAPDEEDALFSDVYGSEGEPDQRIADDFSFAAGSYELGSIEWYGVYLEGDPAPADTFTIRIHADASGLPDAGDFVEVDASAVTRTYTGVDTSFGLPIYAYVVDIAALLIEGDTAYWLSIYNGADPDNPWFWATSNAGLGDGNATYSNGPEGPFEAVPGGPELAFRVAARPIPEPSASLLFALGALVAGGSMRRGHPAARSERRFGVGS